MLLKTSAHDNVAFQAKAESRPLGKIHKADDSFSYLSPVLSLSRVFHSANSWKREKVPKLARWRIEYPSSGVSDTTRDNRGSHMVDAFTFKAKKPDSDTQSYPCQLCHYST